VPVCAVPDARMAARARSRGVLGAPEGGGVWSLFLPLSPLGVCVERRARCVGDAGERKTERVDPDGVTTTQTLDARFKAPPPAQEKEREASLVVVGGGAPTDGWSAAAKEPLPRAHALCACFRSGARAFALLHRRL